MERLTERPICILAGLIIAATCVFGQDYTISARPGAVNYIEGSAFRNGNAISDKSLKSTFLEANDSFSTGTGRAEILLTPGVFLRVGENTEIRMISPSLIDTRVELLRGEIMIEASGLVKDNSLQIMDHGALITIAKNGLYKFTADNPPTAAVLDGKALVQYSDKKVNLKRGKETILSANLAVRKFDTKREDDLYAWSNVRSEYEAAASYRLAREASAGAFGSGYNAFNGGPGTGWYWNSGFSSYSWLPGNGAFYSPFGYGFYSPGYIGSGPVISTSVYAGGRPWRGRAVNGVIASVPVNPRNPPVGGTVQSSPWAHHEARMQAARAYAAANGGGVPPAGGWHGGNSAANPAGGTGRWQGGGGQRMGGQRMGAEHMGGGSRMGGGGGQHMGGGGGPRMGGGGGGGQRAGGAGGGGRSH